MIDVSPNDALSTLKTFRFNSEFVNEITEEHLKVNELEQYKFCVADETLKTKFLKRKDVLDAIVHIVLDHYTDTVISTPEIIKENNDDLLDTDDKGKTEILSLFDITKNATDYIAVADVNDLLRRNTSITKPKAKLILKQSVL